MAMATPTTTPPAGGGNPGIVDLEIDQIDIAPDHPLNAVRIEIVSPAGDGIRCWLDAPLVLDVALRLAGAYARLRRVLP